MPRLSRPRMSHDECRRRTCVGCGMKTDRVISTAGQQLYTDVLVVEVPWDDPRIPLGLCISCYRDLEKRSRGMGRADFPRYGNFHNVVILPRGTRSADVCNCLICQVHYPGGLHKVSPLTDVRALKRARGNPQIKCAEEESGLAPPSTPPEGRISICLDCLAPGQTRGDGHSCTESGLTQRVMDIVGKHPKVGEKVASRVLKAKLASPGGTKRLSQPTGGRNVPVRLGKAPQLKRAAQLSSGDMADIGKACNIKGTRALKNLGTMLHKKTGVRLAEPHLKEKLVERGSRLEHHYTVTKNVLIDGKPQVIVHTEDMFALVTEVARIRGVPLEATLVRVGMDKGQGSLKVSFNLVDLSAPRFHEGGKARVSRPIGEFVDSGVEKILLAAIVERLEETHESVRILFDLINIKSLQGRVVDAEGNVIYHGWVLSSDHKLINLAIGIMQHSSSYPCAWCDAHFSSLDQLGDMRTFGGIRNQAEAYQRSEDNEGKDFKCCVEMPTFGEPTQRVLDLVPPEELHILLGVVNKCVKLIKKETKDFLKEDWPGYKTWLERIHVKESLRAGGGKFNGNDCKRMVGAGSVDFLMAVAVESGVGHVVKPYVDVLRCMDKISSSCFGNQLDPEYKSHIEEFRQLWTATGKKFFPLAHALVFHVPQFCEERDMALGPFSAQAGESLHHAFKVQWETRWQKLPRSTASDPLLRAVVGFSSENL